MDTKTQITNPEEQEATATCTSPELLAKKETNSNKTKKVLMFAIIALFLITIITTALIIFIPSQFERVKNECTHIYGFGNGSKDYFIIDTIPDQYKNTDPTILALILPTTQQNALKAIKHANTELGFNSALYDKMMSTSAIMGLQTEETSKYKVSWKYHPDDGLKVTYEKK